MGKPKFYRGQLLRHVKTGRTYCVIETPRDSDRLEYCNEPYYIYRGYDTGEDHIRWIRRQSEMEDGRFVDGATQKVLEPTSSNEPS